MSASHNMLGSIETGNETYIVWTVTAPESNPALASTAVTFTRHNPDGTEDTASSPDATITSSSETVAGRLVTTWRWRTPVFTQPGRAAIRARSTAGVLVSDNSTIYTPSFSPFATA